MIAHDHRAAAHPVVRRTPAYTAFRRSRDLLLELRADHEAAQRAFSWPRLTHFNWALDWFDAIAQDNQRTALELIGPDGSDRRISYQDLSTRSDQLANWLTQLGIRRGDRVLIVLGTQVELWETLLACLKTGAVAIPTYTSLTGREAADRIKRGRVRHVICRSELVPLFEQLDLGRHTPLTRIAVGAPADGWHPYADSRQAPARYTPTGPTPASDTAFAYFTSGTTSAPKLVIHTHASYPVGHLSSLYFNGLLPGDRHVNISEPGWAKHSWSSFFVPFTAEATLVVPPPECLESGQLPRLLEERDITSLCAPPAQWARLAAHATTARPRLREATTAGEPLALHVADTIEAEWGVTIREGYGQTETTALIGTTPGLPRKPGWAGMPLPGWDLVVRDEQLYVSLADHPVGMMTGYDGDAERTEQVLTHDLYATGDSAVLGHDGYVRLLGRRDDVFKSGSHRVSPYELEAVLRTHPAVHAAAVVPVPHPALTLAAHAVVELEPGAHATEAELLAHVDLHVTLALRVHSVSFTDALPRTASGKVRRSEVGAQLRAARAADSPLPSLIDPEGTIMSATGRPAQQRDVLVIGGLLDRAGLDRLTWQAYVQPGREAVDVHWLYTAEETGPDGAEAYLARFGPGAHGDLHRHLGFELIVVLDGELRNDNGDAYGPGCLVLEKPGSVHRVSSPHGCTLLVIREKRTEALMPGELPDAGLALDAAPVPSS
ncbi:AMP-binding protein [Streptomyces sp. Li-HN-5-11]|uniref:AMP-binding protein n=1 Tax=Streptomyces sp. Li-HN-5-11 TaxID=3075432 RepID=UPI0028A64129|nr:AMP-binding protein [Streptomyces sp. Li-HN-5-11]WNM35896.1 AMP-binding protein [Streptomyces sp. Li-HN-5-11]